MSSLVHKKRQQAVGAEEPGMGPVNQPPAHKQQQNDNNASCPKPAKSSILKKGLQKRSVSFEKLMVTACHIRLVCSCSREALKLCLELLILRSRIMAQQLIAAVLTNLMHLSQKHKFLEPVNAILPKWQNRATMMQRHWRRDMEIRTTKTTPPRTEPTTMNNNRDASPIVEENKKNVMEQQQVGGGGRAEDVKLIDNSPTLMDKNRLVGDERADEDSEQGVAEKRYLRQRLTLAVTGCAILLGIQVILGFALLLQTIHKTPWELYFLCGCVFYIGYLVQSIFNYDRLTTTTYSFGGAKTPPRSPSKIVKKYDAMERRGIDGEVARVIHLSFIEKTMSKVKLL